MNRTLRLTAALAVYIGAIVAANLLTNHYGLVAVGFGLLVTSGTFAAGFALVARDVVREAGGTYWRWWVLAAIVTGAAISYLAATPALALASGVAFTGAELIDTVIYEGTRRWGWARGVLASNAVSAPADTVLFLWLAPFPLTWPALIGQVIAKWVYATCIPVCVTLLATSRRRATV